jgi:hypothetical protein
MAKFIELTIDNSDERIIVNVDKIISMSRHPGINYTIVDLDGLDRAITAKETPEVIVGRAQG